MFAIIHHFDDFWKDFKTFLFWLCLEIVFIEKLNNFIEIFQTPHTKLFSVSMINSYIAKTKIMFDFMQYLLITLVLNNSEFGKQLPFEGSVMLVNANIKAPFSVNEADYPIWI